MSKDPILILQLQRMGDLILTFPLVLQLQNKFPSNPIWMAAEEQFFKDLIPFAPNIVFFPSSHCPVFPQKKYKLAINLSNRNEALKCLEDVDAETKLGLTFKDNNKYIYGFWHLYKMALTQNNRHNLFHFGDLFRLDLNESINDNKLYFSKTFMKNTKRVGLVLGASMKDKRPDAKFWSTLAKNLIKNDIIPVFIGGVNEKKLGEEVSKLSNLPNANFCGKLSLKDLTALMQELSLCITPDTGPMHLADWLNVPVLNLSMGPVQAWETGPISPNQYILRSNRSCIGCWQCKYNNPYCKFDFKSQDIVQIVKALLENYENPKFNDLNISNISLYLTQRSTFGLYKLKPILNSYDNVSNLISQFWQATFLYIYNDTFKDYLSSCYQNIYIKYPTIFDYINRCFKILLNQCLQHIKSKSLPNSTFYQNQYPFLRLFVGYLHMYLQNNNFSHNAWENIINNISKITTLLSQK